MADQADHTNTNTTTGTATSRARTVRKAVRRQTRARLALSGPSGSGKTWTALSVAGIIAPGKPIIVIDTEPGDGSQGAAELYADHFEFDTIRWDPPYDPRDLTATIHDLGREYAEGVGIIDSASHFWRGEGGTLDIADGRFGGWKAATPAQDQMVQAILRSSMHWIVCTRAKQAYEVNEVTKDGRKQQQVQKLGLAPIQRDDLEYEFQVVAMIDTDHRIDVGKTRAAPLAGLSFPANDQDRFAQVYADWLVGGAELPRQVELEALGRALFLVPEAGARTRLRTELKDRFGSSASMTVEQMPEVWEHVRDVLDVEPHRYDEVQPLTEDPPFCGGCGAHALAGWHDDRLEPLSKALVDPPQEPAQEPAQEPPAADPAPAPEPAPEPAQEPTEEQVDQAVDALRQAVAEDLSGLTEDDLGQDDPDLIAAELVEYEARLKLWAEDLKGPDLQAELAERDLPLTGPVAERRKRLVHHMVAAAGASDERVNPDLVPGTEPF